MIDRMKAVMLDAFLLIVFMFAFSALFETIGNVPDSARIGAFLFVFVLYDPIFTSAFGGTLGHMANGLRVKRESDPSKNVFFPLALLRYIAKAFLGWISLLTVSSHPKAKALHDMLVGSVVVFKNPRPVPSPQVAVPAENPPEAND
eukprot:gene23448-43967_t